MRQDEGGGIGRTYSGLPPPFAFHSGSGRAFLEDEMEELKGFFVLLCALLVFMCGVVAVCQPLQSNSCEESWKGSKFQSRYSFWTDCQILTDRGWVPASSYRTTDKP